MDSTSHRFAASSSSGVFGADNNAAASGSSTGSSSSSSRGVEWQLLGHGLAQLREEMAVDNRAADLRDLFRGGSSADFVPDVIPTFQERQGMVLLPDALYEQFETVECKCFMGLFPEIERAWLTVDEKLFLWNYRNGSEFYCFNELDQIIVSVALVKPKPDVFIEEIKYVLVIATPVEIILLGVRVGGGGSGAVSFKGDLVLFPTQLSVPSDNVNMLSIAGTANGRIFMAGRDGNLYELIYQPEDGWFTRKCRKVNCTQTIFANFVPRFLKFSADDPLIAVEYDSDRKMLYTLSERNVIQVFYLGEGENEMSYITSNSSIAQQAERLCSQNLDVRNFRIVSIHAVTERESWAIHLIAIAASGVRIYLTTYQQYQVRPREKVYPSTLRVVHVRLRPPMQPPSTAPSSMSVALSKIHTSFYSSGSLFLANALRDEQDLLTGVSADISERAKTSRQSSSSSLQGRFLETTTCLTIEGKIWAIAERPTSPLSSFSIPIASRDDRWQWNELAVQHRMPAKEFLLLTNSGIHIITKLRPIDVVYQILLDSAGQMTPKLTELLERYGRDEACAMCLQLALLSSKIPAVIRDPKLGFLTTPMQGTEYQVARWATYAFFQFGGEPQMNSMLLGSKPDVSSLARPVGMEGVIFSGVHNGFRILLCRFLRFIWKSSVATKSRDDSLVTISRKSLSTVAEDLRSLKAFSESNLNMAVAVGVSKYAGVAGAPAGGNAALESHQRENQSLHCLQRLLIHSLESIDFLLLLHDNNFFDLNWKSLPKAVQSALVTIDFEGFAATPEGRSLAKELVSSLLNRYIAEGISLDAITALLRQSCPSLLDTNDIVLYKANEMIQKAKDTGSAQERMSLLKESLRLLKQVSASIDIGKHQAICNDYQTLWFYVGIVDLTLHVVAELDPQNLALQFYNDDSATDSDPRRPYATMRESYYDCIFRALNALNAVVQPQDLSPPNNNGSSNGNEGSMRAPRATPEEAGKVLAEIYRNALTSSDVFFHICLYEWLLRRNDTGTLLRIQSPYIEQFLRAKAGKSLEHLDLLVTFLVSHELYDKAAQVLYQSALSEDPKYSLEDRIRFLSRGIAHAKSFNPRGRNAQTSDVGLLQDLEDRLETAKIQRQVYQALQSALVEEERIRILDTTLLDMRQLYHEFVVPFQLSEAALAIVHASGQNDPALIESCWRKIILDESSKSVGALLSKIKYLGQMYYPSDVFPVAMICNELETIGGAAALSSDPFWVATLLRDMNVSYNALYRCYSELASSKLFGKQSHRLHLLTVLRFVLDRWLARLPSLAEGDPDRYFPAVQIEETVLQHETWLREDVARSPEMQALGDEFHRLRRTIRDLFS